MQLKTTFWRSPSRRKTLSTSVAESYRDSLAAVRLLCGGWRWRDLRSGLLAGLAPTACGNTRLWQWLSGGAAQSRDDEAGEKKKTIQSPGVKMSKNGRRAKRSYRWDALGKEAAAASQKGEAC